MKNGRSLVMVFAIALILLSGWMMYAGNQAGIVQAADGDQPTITPGGPPVRKATITIQYTRYSWLLARWSDNGVVCSLAVEHEGVPNYNEIEGLCGKPIAQKWLESAPCTLAQQIDKVCPGYYFVQGSSQSGTRDIEVILPIPEVWIKLSDCNPVPGDRRCSTLPNLILDGEEPLPNETIISIEGTINGEPFNCQGKECRLPLQPTGMEGAYVEFWANSSFGDSSQHYTAKVRLVPWGDFMNPENKSADKSAWYVDVLSSQWTGGELASCSAAWQVFPPLNGPPNWLTSPTTPDELKTNTGYYYLAGSLIQNGLVKADSCLDGGLQAANVASACGVEAARPYLVEWQNRFDGEILQASKDTGIPALVLKNVFARESQVWPGIFKTYKEAGFGQMTEQGADTVLLWNPDFFHKFCPLVLGKAYCDLGFGNLKAPEQNILRGALVRQVNASCASCITGIDLTQARSSVAVFAESLLANCEQVGRIMQNITGQDAGASSSYEDLWRFTLVNYNAGPGCLSIALNAAINAHEPLDWPNVTSHLEPACQGGIGYVEDISNVLRLTPTATPWLSAGGPIATPPRVESGVTPEATLQSTATPLITPTPSPSPTLTVTPGSSQTPTLTQTP